VPAAAADFDGSKEFTCALIDMNSCAAGDDCQKETPESAGIPRFLFVDARHETITGRHADGKTLATRIERTRDLGNLLVMEGAEGQLSWTVTVDRMTGDMSLGAVGADLGFVVFGSCVGASPN
jgi:hypothetical protein